VKEAAEIYTAFYICSKFLLGFPFFYSITLNHLERVTFFGDTMQYTNRSLTYLLTGFLNTSPPLCTFRFRLKTLLFHI